MTGIITIEQIDQIRATFGDRIADRALVWTGTFLEFLVAEGIL
jgi:hypothetical protein